MCLPGSDVGWKLFERIRYADMCQLCHYRVIQVCSVISELLRPPREPPSEQLAFDSCWKGLQTFLRLHHSSRVDTRHLWCCPSPRGSTTTPATRSHCMQKPQGGGWPNGLVTVFEGMNPPKVTLLRSECKEEKLKKPSGKKRLRLAAIDHPTCY